MGRLRAADRLGGRVMWKIRIEYDDKSKITLTGKGKDIDIGLAAALA